ncbi:very-short-patch-repair endonuclease [Oceanisphaera litoralis]|uniref:endonuclease domain-containing protein n=1 Tax=Oceanisphaera litoralis TaxID=225144 RepID=UPI0019567374|nr:endonuclease domain-containing protein [Oceanisphaera litoralis]MBM7454943.1 very-short-patch-repair endonuclease [Oceanisphaera litoralis]
MGRIFNRSGQKAFRRNLRRELTEPEQRLWRRLRAGQLGTKFRRQHGIGPYIADFYCARLKLVIEIDGDSHFADDDAIRHDQLRDDYFVSLNIRVLRFTNREVMDNIDGVLTVISAHINTVVVQ